MEKRIVEKVKWGSIYCFRGIRVVVEGGVGVLLCVVGVDVGDFGVDEREKGGERK